MKNHGLFSGPAFGALIACLCLVQSARAQNVTFTVNASTVTHTISDRLYGANISVYDNNPPYPINTATFSSMMSYSGIKYYRWPGGSYSDMLVWNNITGGHITYAQSLTILQNCGGGIMQPIMNFPTANAAQVAANMVRDYNGTRKLGAKYWEIGNEIYGPWESGHTTGADYGRRWCAFYDSMKAADSTIKIGAVVTPPEPFDTLFSTFSIRALDTIHKLGRMPDFLIVHIYPYIQMDQYPTMFGYNMLPYGPDTLKDTLTTGKWLDTVPSSVDTLNKWVTTYFGASNVGKIEYFYTEFSTGSYATQNQSQAISAMFISQLLMEFTRLGVTGANPWLGEYYTFAGNPTWYVYPMFNFHYGKQVVNVTRGTTNRKIRAWAARDSLGNLTMFLANNSVGASTDTANITIQGASSVGTTGERWTMTTSGAGTWLPQRTAIAINGVASPAANTIQTLAGQTITTGASFNVALAPYSMTWLRIPITVGTLPGEKTKLSALPAVNLRLTGNRRISVRLTGNYPSAEPWSVGIYDIAGREVAKWQGRDAQATITLHSQAHGVFFCRPRSAIEPSLTRL